MGWLSAAISAVGGLLSAKSSAKAQQQANDENWEHTKELYQSRYQWQTEDLKKAGLNPILSVTGGGLAAPATSVPQSQSTGKDYASILSTMLNSGLAGEKLDNEKKEVDNEVAKTQSLVKMQEMQTNKLSQECKSLIQDRSINSAMSSARLKQINVQVDNSCRELVAKVELMRKQGEAALASANLSYENAKLVAPTIQKIAKQTTGVELENQKIEQYLTDPERMTRREVFGAADGSVGDAIHVVDSCFGVIKTLGKLYFGKK